LPDVVRTVPPQLVSRRRDIRNAGVFFNCSRAAVHPQSRRSHRCGLDSVSISYAILPSPLLLAGVAPVQLTSPPSRRVVWEDGMHLTPQHFQAQRRYHEEQTARTLGYMMPFAFGLSAITVDDDGLRNGTFSLVQARGVLPDGTVFHLPDADEAPDPVAVAERFSPTRDAHVVYLALAPWRPDAANVQASALDAPARFRTREEVVSDESTGTDPLAIQFAARNLRILFDEEVTDDVVALPIARIRRDGRGQFQLDGSFVPPCVQLAASDRLLTLARDIVGLLEAKGGALVATLSQAPSGAAGGSAAYMGNELATRWLLHAVRSADAPLRHLLLTRRAHPERLYGELARLAGALCTFSMTSHPKDVPLYDHLSPTDTFDALERLLRAHLDVVISARALVIPLQHTSDLLHVGAISDPRCFEPGVRWFLGVRSGAGRSHRSHAAADKNVCEQVCARTGASRVQWIGHGTHPVAAIGLGAEAGSDVFRADGGRALRRVAAGQS